MNNYIKKIKVSFSLAWLSLKANLLRTSLTVLGIVIGVTAIIVVFAAGDAISNLVLGEVQSYGTNIIQTEIKVPSSSSSFATGEITTLKLDDMEAINKLENVERSYAASLGQKKIKYKNEAKKIFLFGASPDYVHIDNSTVLSAGRFYTNSEDNSNSKVLVLGSKIKNDLFANQQAVNKFVNLDNKKYKVIGVLEERGGSFGGFMDFNEMAFLPIQTLHNRILNIDYAMYFIHELKDVSLANETAEEMKYLLRDRHDISNPDKDDFRVSTMDEMIETLNTVTGAITYLLLAIVLISLLVGGVGIMNIMYVTISERTPEIGLRKALGATKIDLSLQFLVESILITFWGWILGVILGVLISYILSIVATSFGLDWLFIFPAQGILVSFLFSITSGLLFGLRPAKKAANLDPITALRKE